MRRDLVVAYPHLERDTSGRCPRTYRDPAVGAAFATLAVALLLALGAAEPLHAPPISIACTHARVVFGAAVAAVDASREHALPGASTLCVSLNTSTACVRKMTRKGDVS